MSNENTPTGIEAAVCADITARQKLGLAKYGVSVKDNPLTLRQWLEHAYLESLDHAIYLKRAMAEADTCATQARENALREAAALFKNTEAPLHKTTAEKAILSLIPTAPAEKKEGV